MISKMIIAIDFDGTIVEDRFPEIGPVKLGAAEAIREIYKMGHYIIVWTCRNGEAADAAREFLDQNEIPYHSINESNPENVEKYGSDTRKVFATMYIDDRAIGGIPEWDEILDQVIAMSDMYVDKVIREGML